MPANPAPTTTASNEPRAGEQAAEAAADDEHFDGVAQRLAREAGLRVGIVEEVRELARDRDVLLVPVRAQALVALFAVAPPQRGGVEGALGAAGRGGVVAGRFVACHVGASSSADNIAPLVQYCQGRTGARRGHPGIGRYQPKLTMGRKKRGPLELKLSSPNWMPFRSWA